MEDRTSKEQGMDGTFSKPHGTGKKAWQTPNLTEVDYRETRSGGAYVSFDGGGWS